MKCLKARPTAKVFRMTWRSMKRNMLTCENKSKNRYHHRGDPNNEKRRDRKVCSRTAPIFLDDIKAVTLDDEVLQWHQLTFV